MQKSGLSKCGLQISLGPATELVLGKYCPTYLGQLLLKANSMNVEMTCDLHAKDFAGVFNACPNTDCLNYNAHQ